MSDTTKKPSSWPTTPRGPVTGTEASSHSGEPIRTRLQELTWFLPYLRPVKGLVLLVIVTGLSVNLFRVPLSYIPMVLTARYSDADYLYRFLLAMMGCVVLMGLSMLLRSLLGTMVGEHLLRSVRQDLFDRLEHLGLLALSSKGTGEFAQRLARDVHTIRDLFTKTFIQVIDESFRFIVCGAACLWLDAPLTLGLLALFFLVWPLVRWINNRVEHYAARRREIGEEILSQLVENLGGFRDIVASGRFDRFAERFGNLLKQGETYGIRTTFWEETAGILPKTWIGMLLVVPYVMVAGDLQTREDAGRVITFVLLIQQVLPVFGMLAQASSQLAMATPSLRAVRKALTEPGGAPRVQGTPGRAAVVRRSRFPIHSIRFDEVSLHLGGRPILEDLTFTIPGGKFTALIGQSGAGKTTLFYLLLRLVEPTRGTIYINETPIHEIDDGVLRKTLGFIPQNPFIFSQSLRENILIASDSGTKNGRLQEALEIAHLEDMIRDRKEDGGLDSPAGYMGSRLSVGEKQRIALARLVLQDPEVIVCDEYTANIDIRTARLIHETMRTVFADRTRIVITHELYTIKGADHIIVLDRGRVSQEGTHDELLRKPGLYRDLWEIQHLE